MGEIILLIAFAGLPGSGKSSAVKALGSMLNVSFFLEPEEESWPKLIHKRDKMGRFAALTWFRNVRLQDLYDAKEISEQGKIAIVDSYYDNLIALYIKEDCFSWLIPMSDPYFEIVLEMAKKDYELLPTADVLIFLKINEDVWLQFLRTRQRNFDLSASLKDYFQMQDHIENACRTVARVKGIRLFVIEQNSLSAEETAKHISQFLQDIL